MAIAQQNCLNDRCCLCQTPPSPETIALGICSIVKILQVLISCKIQVLMHFLDLRFDWSIFYIHTRTVVKGLGCVNHLLRTNKVGCEGRSRVPQIKTMSKGAPNTDDQVMWPIFWGRGRVRAQMSDRRRGSGCPTGREQRCGCTKWECHQWNKELLVCRYATLRHVLPCICQQDHLRWM